MEKVEYLRRAINDISEQLKRPMSDIERALLVADRKDFREELQLLTRADQDATR